MQRLVIASNNRGKIDELRELLAGSAIEPVAQGELGVEEIEETGASFIENALLKARHAARVTGLPALADDSGLCVDALGGEPGLHSARYAGSPTNAEANIDKLIAALDGLAPGQRGAHFHCVLVLLRRPEDPAPLIAEGLWHGRILEARRGTGGFGYDPVFFDPLLGQSAAELDARSKNRLSHRGQALATLRRRLSEV